MGRSRYSVLLAVLALCCVSSICLAGPFNPGLPGHLPEFATTKGTRFFQNVGASAGVLNGQVEGITGS